ncbi:MAG: DUF748 domain-containing protein [Desulfobulbaceae bacterium]|nr:DUF748 domain-containing protein [Pseudomonadota bacterium]MCG2749670.1 DUF748 domain-containing protein [Desulfobulbaceae bacterium]
MSKNDQDPFGSISISQQPEKTESGQADLDVGIDQPEDLPKTQDKKAAAPTSEPKIEDQLEDLAPSLTLRRREIRKPIPRLPIILAAALVLVLLTYTLIGFVWVPYFFQNVLPDRAEKNLHRAITFGGVSFNPFTLKLTLQNTIIGPNQANPEDQIDPLFSAGTIKADISLSSLFRRQLNCASLTIDNLFLHLVRDEKQQYNLADIVPIRQNQAIPTVNLPFAYFLQNITVSNSRVIFDDLPAKKSHTLEQINLALPLLFHNPDQTTGAQQNYAVSDRYINPRFSALINGSPVELTGKTKVEGEKFQAQLQLHFNDIDLPAYLAYLPAQPGFSLDKGTGEILMDITFLSGPDEQLSLEIETSSHLTGIAIKDRYSHIDTIPQATIRATIYPLLSRYHFKEINLTEPELYLGRRADGKWAFPGLGAPPQTSQEKTGKETSLVVDKVKVSNGRLLFVDDKVTGGFTETFSAVDFTLTDFSRQNKLAAPFTFTGVTSGKSTISLQGDIAPSPLAVTGQVTASQLSLQKLSSYLAPAQLSISQGIIEKFTGNFSLNFDKKSQLRFANGSMDMNAFTLSSQGQIWLILPKAHLSFANLVPGSALADVTLSADNAEIFLKWDDQKNFNWAHLTAKKDSGNSTNTWQVSLSSLELDHALLKIENDFLPTPLRYSQPNVHIKATGLSNGQDQQGNVLIETDELGGGSLSLEGPVTFSPFSANFSCKLNDYRLATLPTLVTDWLNLLRISGNVAAEGEISLPNLNYAGSLAIQDFGAGRENGPDLVSFARAEAAHLAFTLSPLAVNTDEVNCDHAFLQLIIPAKGPVNASSFFSRSLPGLKDFANTGQIAVSRINLSDATLAFSDQRVHPVYTSRLQLNGTLGNLINASGERLHINLTGAAEQQSTGEITGDLGFFDSAFAADFQASLQNMPVKEFSSYLGPLLGYRLQEGRFQFSTTYHQQDGEVSADNTLLVTDLELGEPQGTLSSKLPLTIALLSDQQGKIDLHLPIKGSVADPSYSMARAVGRSLQNIVLKTSVSPFSQLQASFPELAQSGGQLLFTPGKADLSAENKKLLSLFAQLLSQRPLLTVTLKGYADLGRDLEALSAEKKEIARLKELQDELKRSEQITEKYGKEEISPANQQQASPPPPPPRRAVDFSVSKNELLLLAKKRQKAVNDFLVSSLSIDRKRVIQDSSAALIPANAAGRPGNRVDLQFGTTFTR